MQAFITVVTLLQVVAALSMIGLVLVQHGKGADMGASFGSGASGSLFGATGSANFLSRSTAIAATVFFAATLFPRSSSELADSSFASAEATCPWACATSAR